MRPISAKIDNFVQLRTIPPILAAILQVLDKEDSSTAALVEIISRDISLSARLLRVANSVFYRQTSEVKTIHQAVTLLGTRAVKALALSVSLFDIAGGKLSGHVDFRRLWRHNLEMAVLAEHLAGKLGSIQPEEAFACGLLHDLGIIFFIQMMPDEYAAVLKQISATNMLTEIEKNILGVTHAEVGAEIAARWRLPDIFCTSIANHHMDGVIANQLSSAEVWHVVNLAHRYAHDGLDAEPPAVTSRIEMRNRFQELLGLTPASAEEILARVHDDTVSMAACFDIDIGDPWTLLSEANHRLSEMYRRLDEMVVENSRLQAHVMRLTESQLGFEEYLAEIKRFIATLESTRTMISHQKAIAQQLIRESDELGILAQLIEPLESLIRVVEAIDCLLCELQRRLTCERQQKQAVSSTC